MLLEGRVALVTGASRGIGRAIALRFAAEGARLVLCARGENLETVAEEIRGSGGQVTALRGDVRDDAFVRGMVLACRKEFGGLDVLVNNAGLLTPAPLGMITRESMTDMFETNVVAAINLTQYAARLMDAKRAPSITHMTSIAGARGLEGAAVYSGTKGALIAFTYASAKELAPRGIRVNAVAPGFIDTDMTRALSAEWYERRLKSVTMGRPGTPEEVANAALFLASPLASYVTGQVLGVDGGMLA